MFVFFLMIRPPPISTLLPSPTLFRSWGVGGATTPDSPAQARSVRCAARTPRGMGRSARSHQSAAERTRPTTPWPHGAARSEEHTSELQSRQYLVCRLLLEKKNRYQITVIADAPTIYSA